MKARLGYDERKKDRVGGKLVEEEDVRWRQRGNNPGPKEMEAL